ncbi:Uncharacterised protein [Candidatus Burarchaeum australiense]|nr:Uncharacterised protein [Candidatus Burarchaeum australiense]
MEMKMKKMVGEGARKGQVISYDLMLATTVAVALLGVVLLASNTITAASGAAYDEGALVADGALAQLVLTPGSPADWAAGAAAGTAAGTGAGAAYEAHSLGLAERRGVLDKEKVEAFAELDGLADAEGGRVSLRERLGLLREGAAYDFRFEVRGLDGSALYATGQEPTGNVFASRRLVELDGSPVTAVMMVWKK